jgi:ABC-2 type transport system ATP-binding protein
MTAVIKAEGLSKHYGKTVAVDHVSFEIGEGRIVGLVGPNGAGKSTTLKAILGLTRYEGRLSVLGQDPVHYHTRLMEQVSYIADVSSLPEWIKVEQLIILMRGVHPAFREEITRDFLSRTEIKLWSKVKELSRGMKTQLHLALVMGVDARLLVLDEPTLGLDILYRKKFYGQLLDEYFNEQRTILVTTHQIGEIEHILTDILFMHHGRLILDMAIDDIPAHFTQLIVNAQGLSPARAFHPLSERELLNQHQLIFRDVDREQLETLGETSVPSLEDLFVACVEAEDRTGMRQGGMQVRDGEISRRVNDHD